MSVDRAVARRTVDRYLEAANSGDVDALVGLFAIDGEVIHATRGKAKGTAALQAFYTESLAPRPHLAVARLAIDGPYAVAEIVGTSGRDGSKMGVVDHFTLGEDGSIRRNAVYLGGPLEQD